MDLRTSSCAVVGVLALLAMAPSARAADPPSAQSIFCFEEGRGTTTEDNSGHGRTGTLGSAVTWAAGHTGDGVEFDHTQGVNSAVAFGPDDTFDGLSTGSITAWVKASNLSTGDGTTYTYLFGGEGTGTCQHALYLFIEAEASGVYWNVEGCNGGSDDFNGFYQLTATPNGWVDWHHLAYTSDANGNHWYVDGQAVTPTYSVGDASTQAFFSQFSGTTIYRVGNDDYPDDGFNGTLDDVRIYDTPLTAPDVATVMNDTSPCPPSCVGDCGGSGDVNVGEILVMVNIALGSAEPSTCTAGDANGDGKVTVSEILKAVNNVLAGCPPTFS